MLKNAMKGSSQYAPFVLRLVLGAVFIFHGYGKLFGGLEDFAGALQAMGFFAPGFFAILVAVIEFFGGIFLLLGVFTRLSAIVIAIQMVIIVVNVKLTLGFGAMEFDLALLAMAVSVLFMGPGKWSIERSMGKELV